MEGEGGADIVMGMLEILGNTVVVGEKVFDVLVRWIRLGLMSLKSGRTSQEDGQTVDKGRENVYKLYRALVRWGLDVMEETGENDEWNGWGMRGCEAAGERARRGGRKGRRQST